MYESDSDFDRLEPEFPRLLTRARKRNKMTQTRFGQTLGITHRRRVSAIERGEESPKELTLIVRAWLKMARINPGGKVAQLFYLLAGYPVVVPDCPECIEEFAQFLAERALQCDHVVRRIPATEQAKATARLREIEQRQSNQHDHLPTSIKES